MANVSVTLTPSMLRFSGPTFATYLPRHNNDGLNLALGTSLSASSTIRIFLQRFAFTEQSRTSQLTLYLARSTTEGISTGPDFSNQMETEGTIRVAASGTIPALTLALKDADNVDTSEPYIWRWSGGSKTAIDNWIAAVDKAEKAGTLPSLTVTFDDGLAAPKFPSDSTVILSNWVRGQVIPTTTVPRATGNPTPTYSATGLPSGVRFQTNTRRFEGSPTGTGSGTITVTAKNSEGTDTLQYSYTIIEPDVVPKFRHKNVDTQNWSVGTAIATVSIPIADGTPGPTYSANGMPRGVTFNRFTRRFDGTPTSTGRGTITVTALNRAGRDTLSFSYVVRSSDAAPVFPGTTGPQQSWTMGLSIGVITVPAASGRPTPTYSAAGLPDGVRFDPRTRIITGTPTGSGRGTIAITARNSQGMDTYVYHYFISAPNTAPSFIHKNVPNQAWTLNQAITEVSIPGATGNPPAEYSATGIPRGLSFNPSSRFIRGTPLSTGSGTITITARNTVGTDTLSFNYTIGSTSTIPAFPTDATISVSWTQNKAIPTLTVPAATGTPAPTYSASGVPTGITFNPSTRTISGTPLHAGSGHLIVTATNSAGADTLRFNFVIAPEAPANEAPEFPEEQPETVVWTQFAPITPFTVHAATGVPTPKYTARAIIGGITMNLPAGIVFDPDTRVVSGTPTTLGHGVLVIRATNSEGFDEITYEYRVSEAPVGPVDPITPISPLTDRVSVLVYVTEDDPFDITSDVLNFQTFRGKNPGNFLFGQADQGTASIQLKNGEFYTHFFHEENFTPSVGLRAVTSVPGTRIIIKDQDVEIWGGYVKTGKTSEGLGTRKIMNLECVGAQAWYLQDWHKVYVDPTAFDGTDSPTFRYVRAITDVLYTPYGGQGITARSDFGTGNRDTKGRLSLNQARIFQTGILGSPTSRVDAIPAIGTLMFYEGGMMLDTANGYLKFATGQEVSALLNGAAFSRTPVSATNVLTRGKGGFTGISEGDSYEGLRNNIFAGVVQTATTVQPGEISRDTTDRTMSQVSQIDTHNEPPEIVYTWRQDYTVNSANAVQTWLTPNQPLWTLPAGRRGLQPLTQHKGALGLWLALARHKRCGD